MKIKIQKKFGIFITKIKKGLFENGFIFLIHSFKNRLILSIRAKNQKHLLQLKYYDTDSFLIRLKYWFYRKFKSSRHFISQEKSYKYFFQKYNNTWANERTIEIPIILDILKDYKGKRILEVGNVLTHYFPLNHDIIDKYESAPNVINQDILDYNPSKNYDLIVSISTLEHVGWDEIPRDPTKIFKVIKNLKRLLTSKGICIFTAPVGYNKDFDILFNNNHL